ncbi:MAG: toxin-antitoxin system YwqK family antitoxin [Bacteroidota bacterium]
MRGILILISLLSLFCSCKNGENINLTDSTQKLAEPDTLNDGLRNTYFQNGKLKLLEEYQDGQHHGKIKGYFENGNLEFTGSYYQGKKDGEFLSYFNVNKPLEQKIKIKEKWFEGKLIHNKYEYEENQKLKNYYFYNLSGEIYYYERYDENEEMIESNGSKTPVIYSPNDLENLKAGDTLQVIIFAPMSPFCQMKMAARVKDYQEEWEPLKLNFRDNQVVYKKRIDSIGEFSFEVKSMDLCDEKNYINSLNFSSKL